MGDLSRAICICLASNALLGSACTESGDAGQRRHTQDLRALLAPAAWFFRLDEFHRGQRFDELPFEEKLLVAERGINIEPPIDKWLRKMAIADGDHLLSVLLDRLDTSKTPAAISIDLQALDEVLEMLPDRRLTQEQYAICARAAERIDPERPSVQMVLGFLRTRTK